VVFLSAVIQKTVPPVALIQRSGNNLQRRRENNIALEDGNSNFIHELMRRITLDSSFTCQELQGGPPRETSTPTAPKTPKAGANQCSQSCVLFIPSDAQDAKLAIASGYMAR